MSNVLYGIRPIPTVVKTYNIGNPVPENVTATLYSDGLLEFDGAGDIEKYYYTYNEETDQEDYKYAPWLVRDGEYDNVIPEYTITSVKFKEGNTIKPTSTAFLFMLLYDATSIDLSNLDTSNVTDMNYMFSSCSLSSLDVSNFNTSKVTNMSIMFSGCTNLTEIIGLENFNTSNVTDMSNMFTMCESLISLDLSNWDTSKVTDMSMMFDECSSLREIIGLENFNTSNVTRMSAMFQYCNKLTSLDLSNWDTSNVTNMESMFDNCYSLTSLDVSNWDTSNVTNMNSMFQNCDNLTKIKGLENFNTSNVENIVRMFYNCKKLSGTFTIMGITDGYVNFEIFTNAATEPGSQIIVNYNNNTKNYIDRYINTKSENSNVIKGINIDEEV